MKSKLSWRETLEKGQQPKFVEVPPTMARFGKGKMLIPTPMLVDELVRRVPKGKLVTVSELRRKLAADSGADVTQVMRFLISTGLQPGEFSSRQSETV
jgi:hypothetical protein